MFPKDDVGVLVFVNGQEPGNGKVALQDFFPSVGDQIEIVYIACDRNRAASDDFLRSDMQLDLFSSGPLEI